MLIAALITATLALLLLLLPGGSHAFHFTAVDTRALDPTTDGALLLAVQCVVGLMNRPSSSTPRESDAADNDEDDTDAPLAFNLNDSYDALWLQRALPPNATYDTVAPLAFLTDALQTYPVVLWGASTAVPIAADEPGDRDSATTGATTAAAPPVDPSAFLPAVVTLAATLDAVVLDAPLYAQFPQAKVVLDTRTLGWTSVEDSVQYVALPATLSLTTSMAVQLPAYLAQGLLVDWLVARRIWTVAMNGSCIAGTPQHALFRSVVESPHNPWPRPVRVYGYNSMDVVFGGDLFEAETNCVDVLGQVASAHSNNLAFWSRVDPFTPSSPPMTQPVSPALVYDANTTYVALVYGDMDNLDFVRSFGSDHMTTRVSMCAADPASCFPLTWTLSPNLIELAPNLLRWYYAQAASTKGHDWFVMPPSGTLYSYPGEMPDAVQAQYVAQQTAQAQVMATTGAVHWEWVLQWEQAWSTYFPRYANTSVDPNNRGTTTRAFFLNDVPWPIPIPDMILRGETFRWVGDRTDPTHSVVGFRPAFNWQEDGASGGLPYNATVIADLISTVLPRGSVQYVYVIQNTDVRSVFAMAAKLQPHVQLVSYEQLVALARVAPYTPPTTGDGGA